jgi:protein O-mannosyl-transferase
MIPALPPAPTSPPTSPPAGPALRLRDLLVAAGVAALVLAALWPVGQNGFVVFDDGEYVTQNPWVLAGLTWRGVGWAFGSFHSSNWHPLTWLSHMLDVELFGLDAGWHHRVSLLWHAATTVLLFAWLRDATGATWRSALVAALFGVHPLHVESVAWAAERKDVLCAFFFVLALLAYTRWTRHPTPARYATVAAAFAAALLSKPMALSLPVVLLLVDVWPLARLRPGEVTASAAWPLLREKLPLFLLGAASSAVTLAAQGQAGATRSLGTVPWTARIANAVVSYASYLVKTVWPADLAVFYPHPFATGGLAPGTVAASALALAAISAAALSRWRRQPALAAGWAWYLVTLLPAIGIVQVGSQAMADRYTYLPLVGVFAGAAWALPDASRTPALRGAIAAACAAAVVALATAARAQVGVWKDTFTLFRHAADVTRDNWLAWKNLGVEYFQRGAVEEARRAFEASVRAWPHDPAAWTDLAAARSAVGDHAGAADAIRRALALRSDDAEAWYLLGMEGHLSGRPEIAEEALARLRDLRPDAARQLRAVLDGRPLP